MPGGDGTGPRGRGPRTGRMAGYCAGADQPGFTNPFPGWGRRGGWRGFRFARPENPEVTELTAGDQGSLNQRLDRLQKELADIRQLLGKTEFSNPGGQG